MYFAVKTIREFKWYLKIFAAVYCVWLAYLLVRFFFSDSDLNTWLLNLSSNWKVWLVYAPAAVLFWIAFDFLLDTLTDKFENPSRMIKLSLEAIRFFTIFGCMFAIQQFYSPIKL